VTTRNDETHQDAEKKARRGRGDDSIYFDRSKGMYVGAISLGYKVTGSRNRPKVYGRTRTDVKDKLKDLRKELQTGVKSAARYTVADAVNDWLARGLKGRSTDTLKKNTSLARNHVIPVLGKAKLRDLTADDVDDWLESMRAVLATSTLKQCHSILSRSIRQAQRRDKIGRNVADLVTAPQGREGRPSKALTLEQAIAILRAADGQRVHAYLVVSLLTGIRTEEARALTWDRVQLEKENGMPPHIMVWRSVREHGDTKTKKSRRTLKLPPQAVRALEQQRERQERDKARAHEKGRRWHGTGLVFATRYGTGLDAGNVRRAFRSVLRRAGMVDTDWTPRELRHSFVSLMSAHGAPVEAIARLVGHRSTNVTEQVYRKELRPVITEGAEVMGEIFGQLSS
jgi:integrase